jgi:hypothetical protein
MLKNVKAPENNSNNKRKREHDKEAVASLNEKDGNDSIKEPVKKRKRAPIELKKLYFIDHGRHDAVPWSEIDFDKAQVNAKRANHVWNYYTINGQFHPLRLYIKNALHPVGFNDGFEESEKNKPTLPVSHSTLRKILKEGDEILEPPLKANLEPMLKQKLEEYWPMAKKNSESDSGEAREGFFVPSLEVDAETGKLTRDKSGQLQFGIRSANSSPNDPPIDPEDWRDLVGENFRSDMIVRMKSGRRVGKKFGIKWVVELIKIYKNSATTKPDFPTEDEEQKMIEAIERAQQNNEESGNGKPVIVCDDESQDEKQSNKNKNEKKESELKEKDPEDSTSKN